MENQPSTTVEPTEPQQVDSKTQDEQQNSNQTKNEESVIENFSQKEIDVAVKAADGLAVKKQFDDALKIIEGTRQLALEKFGEFSFEVAQLHFQLGHILLQRVEDKKDVFGDMVKVCEKETEAEIAHNQETGQGDQQNEEEATDKKDLVEIAEEPAEDSENVQIEKAGENGAEKIELEVKPEQPKQEEIDDQQEIWEMLEVARVGLEKVLAGIDTTQLETNDELREYHKKVNVLLSKVMVRLGDASGFYDNFDGALQDYDKALAILKTTDDMFYSRNVAETYFLIGNAYLYKNAEGCDDLALNFFHRSRLIIENILYKLMNSTSFKDPEDVQNHATMMSREFIKIGVFDNPKSKEIKEILNDLYNRIEDTTEQKKERAKVQKELEKAKQNSAMADKLESQFAKSAFSGSNDPNGENKPPVKVIHLGTLGNAKKRTREMMESAKPMVPIVQNKSPGENGDKMIIEGEKGMADTGVVTQADEAGHPEKMVKLNPGV